MKVGISVYLSGRKLLLTFFIQRLQTFFYFCHVFNVFNVFLFWGNVFFIYVCWYGCYLTEFVLCT